MIPISLILTSASQIILPYYIFYPTAFFTAPACFAYIVLCLVHHPLLWHMTLSENIRFLNFPIVGVLFVHVKMWQRAFVRREFFFFIFKQHQHGFVFFLRLAMLDALFGLDFKAIFDFTPLYLLTNILFQNLLTFLLNLLLTLLLHQTFCSWRIFIIYYFFNSF